MKTIIYVNQIIEIGRASDAILHRVLHIADDEIALFELRDKHALPVWWSTDDLVSRLGQDVHATESDEFASDYLPDDLITTAAKTTRQRRHEILPPILLPDEKGDMPILRPSSRDQLVMEAVARHGTAKDKVYVVASWPDRQRPPSQLQALRTWPREAG